MENDTKSPVVSPGSLATIVREEFDISIATAKKYPRSLTKFREDAMTMATHDVDVAASCFYKLRRNSKDGAKSIEGPSVRLAEIVASAWGNLRFGARIIGQEDGFIIAQGIAHDLETNVSTTVEVRRRITTSEGKLYGADMIGVTANAACSIALRNAIFKAVPFSYAKAVYEAAKKTAIGDAKTLVERRTKMVQEFAKMGVTMEQILAYTGKTGADDLGLAEIEDLIGAFNAIKDGDSTVDEVFGKKGPEQPKRKSEVEATAPQANAELPVATSPATEPIGEYEKHVTVQNPKGMSTLNRPESPVHEEDGEVQTTNQKQSGGKTKYGIQTKSGKWLNTFNKAYYDLAARLVNTGFRLKFKFQQTTGGFDLVELTEIPPAT